MYQPSIIQDKNKGRDTLKVADRITLCWLGTLGPVGVEQGVAQQLIKPGLMALTLVQHSKKIPAGRKVKVQIILESKKNSEVWEVWQDSIVALTTK